jgi:hypothetical protein
VHQLVNVKHLYQDALCNDKTKYLVECDTLASGSVSLLVKFYMKFLSEDKVS